MWTLVGIGLGALVLLALMFLLDQLSRRRSRERDRSTLQVAVLLGRQDEGLRLLAANVDRPAPWWTTTPKGQLRRIDEALSDWARVAGQVADGTVDLDVVLDAYGPSIVAMWEDAYTYVEDQHPELWEPLLDLYAEACEAGHSERTADSDVLDELLGDVAAVTPDEVPEVGDLPAELLTPLIATSSVTAAAPNPPTEDRLSVIQAALQPVTIETADVPPAPPRRTVAEVDGPAELLIDLIDTSVHHGDGPLPRAVHR